VERSFQNEIDMEKLKNKVAVVTGGNSGIGYATAEELAAQGATVVITGRNPEATEKAAKALNVKGFVSDQGDLQAIDKLVFEVRTSFGNVDILFINAGVASFAPLDQITEDEFDKTLNVNFKGSLFTLQKFLPILNEGASVIFLSSINAYASMPNSIVYSTSKAALNSLMRTAAFELAPKKIRVNAVAPGPIVTPIFEKLGFTDEAFKIFQNDLSERIPLKRFGKPSEVAKLVTFLGSDDAAFITGSEYLIDGGITLNSLQ
jgi:NAD(P)-dependent dehydrogenase (short-subunit alcohol dehydrogenase family)